MIQIRRATLDDLDLLYQWSNDLEVRNNSFSLEHISYEEHCEWFNRIMHDDHIYQYILMDNDLLVGQIRLNINGDEAEISYSIAKEYRGKGYGRKILQLIQEEVSSSIPEVKKLIAKVKPDNIPSNKLFSSENYDPTYILYSKNIERS